MDAKPDTDRDGYQPPAVEDIDSSEDREFAVVPGPVGSPVGARN